MPNVKISDLPAASSAAGTDQLETNQGGTSRRLTVAQVATHVRSTATDTVVVAAGSAAAPSIAPTGDSNTGIFFPAADTIAFSEGGVEALRLDSSGNATFAGTAAMASSFLRNRIINGDMRIDQRNAGAAVTTHAAFPVDRFQTGIAFDGTFSAQRSTVAPAGFTNSLLFTVTSPDASIGASQYAILLQNIEGFNTADLGWGAAGAQTVTLSFWVRCSATGTFGGAIRNGSFNRSYPFTYSISAANTWEYKTVVIAGDTTGTWATDNSVGITVFWSLGAGSSLSGTAGAWAGSNLLSATGATSILGTNGATFYLTGVQLEVGSAATPFERRQFGTEIMLCQRYFQRYAQPLGRGVANTGTLLNRIGFPLLVAMRAAPSASMSGTLNWYDGTELGTITAFTNAYSTVSTMEFDAVAATGTSAQYRSILLYIATGGTGVISLSAEL